MRRLHGDISLFFFLFGALKHNDACSLSPPEEEEETSHCRSPFQFSEMWEREKEKKKGPNVIKVDVGTLSDGAPPVVPAICLSRNEARPRPFGSNVKQSLKMSAMRRTSRDIRKQKTTTARHGHKHYSPMEACFFPPPHTHTHTLC